MSKAVVEWRRGYEPFAMVCDVYLDGIRLVNCQRVDIGHLALYPGRNGVLRGEKEGHFTFRNGVLKEIMKGE